MEIVKLGSQAKVFKCNDCEYKFIWHPGSSGLEKPSGCGSCDSQNIVEIEEKVFNEKEIS